jgi:hypothetical protein
MDRGTNIHALSDLTGEHYKGHYIALRLKEPWSEEQKAQALAKAMQMVEINRKWADNENIKLKRVISVLPLPNIAKAWLSKILHVTGYDWFGTFMGRVASDRFTCIGACIQLYRQMGVPLNHYGTGLLGFGTTLFDPILPVRFLSDPAFELITTPVQEPIKQTVKQTIE